MTDDEQEARSLKFDRRGTVCIRQLSSGKWAMYEIGGVGSPFWIGDFSDLLEAYNNRPEPKIFTCERKPAVVRGIDTSKLDFRL